jgi:hypothetical protein
MAVSRKRMNHVDRTLGLDAPDGPAVSSAATSDVPPAMPAESAEALRPHPAASAGGLDNLPEDLLPGDEQAKDELDHSGLDIELPDEDRARAQ